MTRSIQLLFLLFIPLFLSAQVKKPWNDPGYDNKTFHFGFSAGMNSMDFEIKPSMKTSKISDPILIPDVSNIHLVGFQVQIVSNLKLAENLDLRFLPGICFGDRTINFYSKDTTLMQYMDFAYLDFPLDLKYRTRRLNNYRPYILGGLNFRYDLGRDSYEEIENYIVLSRRNIFSEIGVGIDFYLPYFKLSTELKVGIGLLDTKIIKSEGTYGDNMAESIGEIKPYIVGLSFHFE